MKFGTVADKAWTEAVTVSFFHITVDARGALRYHTESNRSSCSGRYLPLGRTCRCSVELRLRAIPETERQNDLPCGRDYSSSSSSSRRSSSSAAFLLRRWAKLSSGLTGRTALRSSFTSMSNTTVPSSPEMSRSREMQLLLVLNDVVAQQIGGDGGANGVARDLHVGECRGETGPAAAELCDESLFGRRDFLLAVGIDCLSRRRCGRFSGRGFLFGSSSFQDTVDGYARNRPASRFCALSGSRFRSRLRSGRMTMGSIVASGRWRKGTFRLFRRLRNRGCLRCRSLCRRGGMLRCRSCGFEYRLCCSRSFVRRDGGRILPCSRPDRRLSGAAGCLYRARCGSSCERRKLRSVRL